jgi:hypothetical protein
MPKRRLVVEVWDDTQTTEFHITRYDEVGGVEIGPIEVGSIQRLSFPSPTVEEWMRDMAVCVVELL